MPPSWNLAFSSSKEWTFWVWKDPSCRIYHYFWVVAVFGGLQWEKLEIVAINLFKYYITLKVSAHQVNVLLRLASANLRDPGLHRCSLIVDSLGTRWVYPRFISALTITKISPFLMRKATPSRVTIEDPGLRAGHFAASLFDKKALLWTSSYNSTIILNFGIEIINVSNNMLPFLGSLTVRIPEKSFAMAQLVWETCRFSLCSLTLSRS